MRSTSQTPHQHRRHLLLNRQTLLRVENCPLSVHSQSLLTLSAESLGVLGVRRLVFAVCLPHVVQRVAQVVQLARPKFAATPWWLSPGPKPRHHAVVDRGEKKGRKSFSFFVYKIQMNMYLQWKCKRTSLERHFIFLGLKSNSDWSCTCPSVYPDPGVCLQLGPATASVP